MENSRYPGQRPSQRRSKRQEAIIHSDTGPIILPRDEVTEISEEGITTTETVHSLIVGGIKVTSHLQIAGQCQVCAGWVVHRTFRFCVHCNLVLCARCAKRDEEEQGYLCPDCAKKIARKRFWVGLWHLVSAPFVERSEK